MKVLILLIALSMCSFAIEFNATLVFRNPTGQPVTFEILRGDFYEASDQGEFKQNVIANENRTITVEPYQTVSINIEMRCIDPDRPPPSPGHQIRPTIFRTPNPGNIDQRIQEIMNGVSVNTRQGM